MKTFLVSFKILLFFTILTGIAYPLFVTGIAQVFFPGKANGSLITRDNNIIGSELIGQQFDSTIYFSSRPSATGYNPLPSGGSNFGPTNLKLKCQVSERRKKFVELNGLDSLDITFPAEMLFASASGLDPHISPNSALLQLARVARARNFNAAQTQELRALVNKHTKAPQYLCLGEKRVNVLLLNLSVDELSGR